MKFKTAIVDPPWPYRKVNGDDNNLGGFAFHKDKKVHYELMTMDDLSALPVGNVVSGYLFMWVAKTFLQEGLDLFKAWGFEFKSYLIWHKMPGKGVGYWFRGDSEMVMVGVKTGLKIPSLRTNESDVLMTPLDEVLQEDTFIHRRIGHSTKPKLVHELIEKRRPLLRKIRLNSAGEEKEIITQTSFPGPYLEIFGREKEGEPSRPGWTVVGNEANGTRNEDILISLKNLIAKEG